MPISDNPDSPQPYPTITSRPLDTSDGHPQAGETDIQSQASVSPIPGCRSRQADGLVHSALLAKVGPPGNVNGADLRSLWGRWQRLAVGGRMRVVWLAPIACLVLYFQGRQ